MINPKTRLTVVYFDGVSYSDFTRKAGSFSRDSFDVTIAAGEYLYIGYSKPINAMYFNLLTANTNTSNVTMEYYNGDTASWVTVESLDDDTNGFSRSAFIQWDRDLEDEGASQPDPSMNEQFYYRLSLDADSSAVTHQGINIVFSDDEDLKKEFYCVTDGEILQGASSHILIHEAARDEILQTFRNRNIVKQRSQSLVGRENLIAWDLLDIQEVREGAKYLALNKIFFNMSDSPDDIWNQKALYYRQQYEEKIDIARLSWDYDNDGETDDAERLDQIKPDRMNR